MSKAFSTAKRQIYRTEKGNVVSIYVPDDQNLCIRAAIIQKPLYYDKPTHKFNVDKILSSIAMLKLTSGLDIIYNINTNFSSKQIQEYAFILGVKCIDDPVALKQVYEMPFKKHAEIH